MSYVVKAEIKGSKKDPPPLVMNCSDAACLRDCLSAILAPQAALLHMIPDSPAPGGKKLDLTIVVTSPEAPNWSDKTHRVAIVPPAVEDALLAAIGHCHSAPCVMKAKAP